MKTIIRYQFEPSDPSIGFIMDSLANLSAFVEYNLSARSFTKGEDGEPLLAIFRLTGKDGFSEQDVRDVAAFLVELAARANAKYQNVEVGDAPWRETVLKDAADAIAAGDALLKLFYERAPNIKPIAEPAPEPVPPQPAPQPATTEPPKP